MTASSQKTSISRRDFLRIALTYGATVPFASILEACNRLQSAPPTEPMLTPTKTATLAPALTPTESATLAPTLTPALSPTETPFAVTAGLEGLDIEAFLEESIRRLFLRDPEGITINGLATVLGVRNDQMTDVSDAFIRETQRLQGGILDLLKQYDKTAFTPNQAINASLYEWYLDDLVRGFPFMYNDYLVMPFVNSLNWTLQFLLTEAQPLTNTQDAQDYIARLQQMNTKLAQVLDDIKRRQDFGVILPSLIFPDLLTDLRQYTGGADWHPYYTTFSTKINKIRGLNSVDRKALFDQAKQAVKETVIPAYQSLIDYYEDLESAAPKEVGIWRYSNGKDYYAYILRHYTTTELIADEIHQIGLENVARIQDEMRQAFSQLGYPARDSFASLMSRLGDESGYVSGDQGVAAYQAAIDQATGMLDQAFDVKLREKIAVVGGNAGNYFTPPPRDGSRAPMFFALTDYEQPKYPIKSIAFHEAVPGHGYQFDVARQMNLPLFRDAIQYDGYVEGWALYAERLMWELGAYEDDPAGNLGRLDMELLRAVRCVLDTGIHAKKWTYDQAVQYMTDARGVQGHGEIRRYIMWPAQATSYYVGFLKILELRQRAKDQLGSRFDLKEFHHVLLDSGQVPLAMLEQLVDAYIAAAGS